MIASILGWAYEHFLWRWTAGRPWTYVFREVSARHPHQAVVVVLSLVAAHVGAAAWVGTTFGWWAAILITWDVFLGFVLGHLFWDTAGIYIKKRGRF